MRLLKQSLIAGALTLAALHQSADAEWSISETHDDISGYTARPDDQTLQTVTVDWQRPAFKALGRTCIVRGLLRIPGDKPGETKPVSWFQGVTVSMAAAPDTRPDWSKGMSGSDALTETTVVTPTGEFTVEIDVSWAHQEQTQLRSYQFGLALAQHTKLGNKEQRIEWNSRTPAVASSVKMLDVPAAPELSHEIDLINRAAGWPFSNPDGVALIRAVNALHRLGKTRALATLDEYHRHL